MNTNNSNAVALDNFLKNAKAAKKAISTRYHDGEFSDPANDLATLEDK